MLTTHYLDEAEMLCDRVAIMDEGSILENGPPASLVRGLDAPTRIAVESGAIAEAKARALFGDADVSDDEVSLTIATRAPSTVLSALADAQRPARVVGTGSHARGRVPEPDRTGVPRVSEHEEASVRATAACERCVAG